MRYSATRKVYTMYADLGATYSLFSKAGLYTIVNTPTRDRVLTNQRLETVQGIY